MPANEIKPPYPIFFDRDSQPLEAGFIYLGPTGLNPESNDISVYWDEGLTQPAAQPLRTLNGYISNNGTPGRIYVDADSYSITVRNARSEFVWSSLDTSQAIPFSSITGLGGVSSEVESVAALVAARIDASSVYITSYHGGWAATVEGPKGGHRRHKTGATNAAPSFGAPQPVSTIGTGVQAGFCWDASGDEWRVTFDGFIMTSWLGAQSNGAADDLAAINDTITLAGTQPRPPEVWIPPGRSMVSGTVNAKGYNDLVMRGFGVKSQIFATNPGYTTIEFGQNNVRLEMWHVNIYAQNNHIGILWEGHQGGIFHCHVNPTSATANAVTCIQLTQRTSGTGSWLTNIENCTIDFDQSSTATNCVGIDLIGAANRTGIFSNTIAGFNGVGIRQAEWTTGADTQMINIAFNDIESMDRPSSTNYAIDFQGQASVINVHNNYFEGIEGIGSRFVRIGSIATVRGFSFHDNHCLTNNPIDPSFRGIEIVNALAPDIYHNYGAPAGALDIFYDPALGLLEMSIPNQLNYPLRGGIYDLMNVEQTAPQNPVSTAWVDVVDARSSTPLLIASSVIATFEVVYTPSIGAGEIISFVLNQGAGGQLPNSDINNQANDVLTRKFSRVIVGAPNDLIKIQGMSTVIGSGWQVLSAKLYIHTS